MEAIEELIATVLGIDRARVVPDLGYQSVAQWDSLNHVNLMLALEQELGTTIDADSMVELTNVRAILDYAASVDGAGGA